MAQDTGTYELSSEGETEGTSEADIPKVEEDSKDVSSPMQLLQEKADQCRKMLQQLSEGTHVDYQKGVAKLERGHRERVQMIETWRSLVTVNIESEHDREHQAAQLEYDTRRQNLKETLMLELDERKKKVEADRSSMELHDAPEQKTIVTRKLRRRPHDGPQQAENGKRSLRRPGAFSPAPLAEEASMSDLLTIYKGKLPLSLRPLPVAAAASVHTTSSSGGSVSDSGVEVKLQDGKLFYDKKVFIRGQPVFLDQRDGTRISGTVQSITQTEVYVRKTSGDQGRIKVPIQALLRGKYSVRKRST